MFARLAFVVVAGLIFGAPAFAQKDSNAAPNKPKPDWIADANGCRVWNPVPEANESITWSGECPKGFAQGQGVLQWFQNGKPGMKTEGTFVDGHQQGPGKSFYTNGNIYAGEFKDDRLSGHGKYTYKDGTYYSGQYIDGRAEGRGVETYADGGRYDGEFQAGVRSGHGVYYYANGNRYDGGWLKGERSGHGVVTFKSGSRLEGEFRDGQANGHMVMAFASGARFDGEYRDGKPNGYGTYTGNGQTYAGDWTNGCFKQGNREAWVGTDKASCGFK